MPENQVPKEADKEAELRSQYEHDDGEPAAPEGTPQETTPEAPPAPPKTPRRHPADLVDLAVQYGANRDDIDQTTTGELAAWVRQAVQREREETLRMREEVLRREIKQRPQAEPKEDDFDWGKDEVGNPIVEEDLNPALRRMIRKQHDEIKQLKSSQKKIAEEAAANSARAVNQSIDDAFALLPDKFTKLFGSGALAECTSEERNKRMAILRAAAIDPKNLPSAQVISKRIQQTYDALTPPSEQPAAPADGYEAGIAEAPKNGRYTKEQFAAAALAPATQRTAKAQAKPNTREGWNEAKREFLGKARELGLTQGQFDEIDAEDFPK